MRQPRGPRFAIVWLALAVTGAGAQQQVTLLQIEARKAELQQMLDAYAAGDRDIVSRTLRSSPDQATRLALSQLLGDRKALWQPVRAAFTLEAAVAYYRNGFLPGLDLVLTLTRLGRSQVVDRPTKTGEDAIEDRFEVLWHQIALALIQGMGAWDMHNDYVTGISVRMLRMAHATPPMPSRFAFAHAVNATMQCCRALVSSRLERQVVIIMSGGRRVEPPVVRPDQAIALFEAAAEDPALREDALVRKAHLEAGLDRLTPALITLDRAAPMTDNTLAYAAALIRAGVLDRQAQPGAAAEAYGTAQRLAPAMQAPAIGRAAALQRAGRPDEAVAAAQHARRLPAGGVDPWPIFIRADARFIDAWLLELRTLLK